MKNFNFERIFLDDDLYSKQCTLWYEFWLNYNKYNLSNRSDMKIYDCDNNLMIWVHGNISCFK